MIIYFANCLDEIIWVNTSDMYRLHGAERGDLCYFQGFTLFDLL